MEWIGVALASAGTLCSAVGMQLIRSGETKSNFRLVILGNALVVFMGSSLDVTALAFAPESTLAPLGGLVVLWTVVITAFTTRTPPSAKAVFGTLLVVGGCGSVVAVGPAMRRVHPEDVRVGLAFATGVAYCVAVLVFHALDDYKGLAYVAGITAGIVGGFSNTMAKALAEATELEHESWALFSVASLVFAGLQLLLLNVALRHFPPMHVNPPYMVTFMLSVVLLGAETYDEFNGMTLARALVFACGVSLAATGTWILAAASSEEAQPSIKDQV